RDYMIGHSTPSAADAASSTVWATAEVNGRVDVIVSWYSPPPPQLTPQSRVTASRYVPASGTVKPSTTCPAAPSSQLSIAPQRSSATLSVNRFSPPSATLGAYRA